MRHLSKNKNIVIYEADKGDTIVILHKTSYVSVIESVASNHSKFSNHSSSAGKEINYITNVEKKIASILKLLKKEGIINKTSGKVHKETKTKLAPFYPIFSVIHLLTN